MNLFGNFPQSREQKISPPSGEYMPAKFHTTNDVVSQAENAMACCLEFLVPNELAHSLEALYLPSLDAARKMLKHRHESSSKFYRSIPCVIAKSLIAKYQRNPKCRQIRNLVLPICGDKGRQIKLENGGIRIPAIFKKAVIPIAFRKAIIGHIRGVEFYRRNGKWLGILCYNTAKAAPVNVTGCIGVDRNSVGNVAVFADPHTGTVRKLGLCPAKTKAVMRGRRKNLQKTGKFQLLSKLRRKQRRRMTHENHRVSKTLVDYAAKHCRAVAIEKLDGVRAPSSKIRRYSEKNQWAFAQLETFLRYKCALRGVPVIAVNPAWTSQTCCRCGSRHKPNAKLFSCGKCGRTAHRDVNASFVIAKLGLACIGGGSDGLDVSSLRYIGDAQAEKDGAK
jgi:IS605 OrfB family transposase